MGKYKALLRRSVAHDKTINQDGCRAPVTGQAIGILSHQFYTILKP